METEYNKQENNVEDAEEVGPVGSDTVENSYYNQDYEARTENEEELVVEANNHEPEVGRHYYTPQEVISTTVAIDPQSEDVMKQLETLQADYDNLEKTKNEEICNNC